ncbi:MAG: glutamine synthetase type III [Angelakisella sp.]|jgi:glutamine synthetase|nr:glutamine synthetase type III [Angelakisella sp.]
MEEVNMNPHETFGCRVFSQIVMRERLPQEVWERLEQATHSGGRLDPEIAQTVADAMRQWALEQGATHFTHWFQPMTGITAGKFDAFLSPDGEGGAITEFSGKSLFVGEPDASSFPSGGLRATFEARGYTAWDPTSPAFVKDDILYIPTAFCAYTGQALDAKTPLLRSVEAVNREAVRFCQAIGMEGVTRVDPSVGAEQEYFIVDRDAYESRLDLKICGVTLQGAPMPKGQELDDHYLGRIRLRIRKYMEEVDRRLWKLGVPVKTKHNEVAPAQHELALVYEGCNIACDHNQLVMEVLRQVAKEQGLACLLHEKPFAKVNGSGKHNNYSLSTNTGVNLLSPGKDPTRNTPFLLTLCAFLRGVDSYPELLRLSTATAGNDLRLGGSEAPPSIISVFLGDALLGCLHQAAGEEIDGGPGVHSLNIGVSTSPELTADDSDRNRTSPLAFTGNKFEFRMVGSSQSIALANTVLNTLLADSFNAFAIYFEEEGFTEATVRRVIAETLRSHGRVVFNGDNYSQQWVQEAMDRGLPVIGDTVQAMEALEDPKNWKLLERFGVFTAAECASRHEIMVENYNKVVGIEAATLVQMVRRQILPAVARYTGEVARDVRDFNAAMGRDQGYLEDHLEQLSNLTNAIANGVDGLEWDLMSLPEEPRERAAYMRDVVRRDMGELRGSCDRAEVFVPEDVWPIPTYTQLVHYV